MVERTLDVWPFGVRRQSEVATALLLIQFHPLNPKWRRASLAPALNIFGATRIRLRRVPLPMSRDTPFILP